MSITFTTDIEPEPTPPVSCMCAQMAPRFSEATDIESAERALPLDLVEHLREHAWPTCGLCKGAGVMEGGPPATSYVHLNEANGQAVLSAIGYAGREHGRCSIVFARTALSRALGEDLRAFERPGEHVVSIAPVVAEALGAAILEGTVLEGVAKLAPPAPPRTKRWSPAFTSDDMKERLGRLHAFVEVARAQGATELRWY